MRQWTTLHKYMWFRILQGANAVYETLTGNPVSFTAVASPLRQLLASFSPVQSLNGYDSPWPGGGGKNKFNPNDLTGTTYTVNADETISVSGSDSRAWASVNAIPLKAGTWTFSGVGFENGSTCFVAFSDDDYETSYAFTNGMKSRTFTFAEDVSYKNKIGTSATQYPVTFKFQVESGNQATAWTPYSNICPISGWTEAKVWREATYDPTANPALTIDLDGTRYGGTLDVLTGVLTVDRELKTVTSSDLNGFNTGTNTGRFACLLSDAKAVDSSTRLLFICNAGSPNSRALTSTAWLPGDCILYTAAGNTNFYYCPPESVTSLDEAKAWVTNNPVQVCYTLATPVTYQLTPQDVTTLLGENNVWSDANGDLTVEYRES